MWLLKDQDIQKFTQLNMGWDHVVSETREERFVFRERASPLCVSECVKLIFISESGNSDNTL